MKKYTINQLWAFVNRIDVDDPKETRGRAETAILFLDKCDYLPRDVYNDMMDCIAYLVRESYHRERYNR